MVKITRDEAIESLKHQYIEAEIMEDVVQDILSIVNDGKRYPPRGNTCEFRIPEDISTGIAIQIFGVNAYHTQKHVENTIDELVKRIIGLEKKVQQQEQEILSWKAKWEKDRKILTTEYAF